VTGSQRPREPAFEPVASPAGESGSRGATPWPEGASESRTLSSAVAQTLAWCDNRSTVAVARVLGISSSKAGGYRLVVRSAATGWWSGARSNGDDEALRGGLVLKFGCPDRRGADPES